MVRDINEDACLDKPEQGLWAVADGMGGHARGDVASRMVIEALSRLESYDVLERFVADAKETLLGVNRRLREEADLRSVSVIGSTVVALLACGAKCAFLWAGDSRLYLYRGGQLQQLTRDHSQLEELKSRIDAVPEQTLHQTARNLITRAVGATDTLEPDVETMTIEDGDMFLLCSDGLSNEVNEEEIRSALVAGNCGQAAEVLIDMALHHGGRDNVSVVVARVEDLHSSEKTVLNPAL
jgi:protein phosphatase